MFVINCPRHGGKVLVFEPRIRTLRNTASGIVLDVECWCGEHVTVQTGRRQPPPAASYRRPLAGPRR